MTKDMLNKIVLGIAVIAAAVCFYEGKDAGAMALLAFAGGHLLRSPLTPAPEVEQ